MNLQSLGVWLCLLAASTCSNADTYRAAVFEISPVIQDNPLETLRENAKIYELQIARAAQQGVQIIAFPEYGLTSMHGFDNYRDSMKLVVPEVHDPRIQSWNPCDEPEKFKNSEVLQRISCAAKSHSIVVLINVLTQRPCNSSEDSKCRSDNSFLHNSNVVFSKDGSVLALYHKTHLFMEEDTIDPATNREAIIFDVGFAKFGTFVCWDIAYSHPSAEYVKEHEINNIIYSTAWGGELPFITDLQLFNAWARGLNVNLVAANLYLPEIGRLGSGIFSSSLGPLNLTFDLSKPNRLIIADVPIVPGEGPAAQLENVTFIPPNSSVSFESTEYYEFTDIPTSEPINKTLRVWYQNLTDFDYHFLNASSGEISACQKNTCCHLKYTYAEEESESVRHALLIRDGTRPFVSGRYNWSEKICAVVRCEKSGEPSTCGRVPKDPAKTTSFSNLELKSSVDADLLFPHLIAPDFQLPNVNHYSYVRTNECASEHQEETSTCKNEASLNLLHPTQIMVFGVVGKFYNDGR